MPSNQTEVTAIITAKANGKAEVDNLKSSVNNLGGSVDQLSKQQARFDAELNRTIATFGKGKAGALEYRAAQLGLADSYAPQIAKLKEMEAAANAGGHAMTGMAGQVREGLVVMREIGRGDFNRLAGSATILAQRMGLLELVLTPVGLSIAAAAVAGAGLAVVYAKGAEQSEKLRESMILTGGAAGITEGQFNSLADTIGKAVPGQAGKARGALQDLVSTGRFGSQALQVFGEDVLTISKLSGEKTDAVVKDFAKMEDGVAKWASEHNRQYHFLNLAEYDYIDALEKSGDKQGAMLRVAGDLKKAMKDQADDAGYLAKAWDGVKDAIGGVVDGMLSWGRADTPEARIGRDQKAIEGHQQLYPGTVKVDDPFITNLRQDIAQQQKIKADKEAAASAKATAAATQEAGIAAQERVTHLREETNQQVKLNKELSDYRRDVAAMAAAGKPVSAAQQRTDEAAIRHKYDKTGNKVESDYDRTLKGLQGEGVALSREVDMLGKYGVAMDKSRLAVLNWNLEHDKTLSKLSDSQKATLRAAASRDDSLADQKTRIETTDGYEKKVKAMEAEAAVQSRVKGASAEAVLQQEIETKALILGAAKVKELTDRLDTLAKKRVENDVHTKLGLADDAFDKEILKINAETEALGKSTLEKQHAVVVAQKLAEANKLIADDGLHGAQADAVRKHFQGQADQINAANDGLYAKSRSGSVGMSSAFETYTEQITNKARQVQSVWGNAMKNSEDALVNFVETGKLNFKSLVDSIIKDVVRMEVEDAIMAPIIASLRTMMGLGPVSVPKMGAGDFAGGNVAFAANGGVMTSAGMLPLPTNAYGNGGIATGPQIAVYGEARNPEAYVPLPDGRTIPVTMKGQGQASGGHTFNTSVVVNSDGSAQANGPQQGQAFARAVQAAIRQELLNQSRDGGLLSRSPTGV